MIHIPSFPALPVLPDLWIYDSISLGGLHYIIKSTCGKSNPLAATLVATKHLNFPFLNPSNVTVLYYCGISPCNGCVSAGNLECKIISLHSLLVSQKIIVLACLPP